MRRIPTCALAVWLAAAACSSDTAPTGSKSPPTPTGPTNPPASPNTGRIVFWTREASILPVQIFVGDNEVARITAPMGQAPACNAAGAATIDAPVGASIAVVGFSTLGGNWRLTASPRSDCGSTEIVYQPTALSIAGGGSGSGTIRSASGAINCTVTNGVASGPACTAVRTMGSVFGLTATPATGSVIAGWKNGCAGSSAECNYEMTASTTLAAVFEPREPTLIVKAAGTGLGSISTFPLGIGCAFSDGLLSDCSHTFQLGDQVNISARAGDGTVLKLFDAPCARVVAPGNCVISMDHGVTVTIGYESYWPRFSIGSTTGGTGTGDVGYDGARPGSCHIERGESTGAMCLTRIAPGTVLNLTAQPYAPYAFLGWGGACAGTTGTKCRVTVNANTTVFADFGVSADVYAVRVTVPKTAIAVGEGMDIRGEAINAQGVVLNRTVSWSSSSPGAAGVTATGSNTARVQGLANGSTSIVGSVDGKSTAVAITVGSGSSGGPSGGGTSSGTQCSELWAPFRAPGEGSFPYTTSKFLPGVDIAVRVTSGSSPTWWVTVRNRYTQTVHLSLAFQAGVAPARTTDRLDVPAGGTDATWFALPLNTNNYLLIDEVRFGQDSGPYYCK